MFQPGEATSPGQLWKAVKDGGFTPVRIEIKDQVYEGPQSPTTTDEGTNVEDTK